MKNDLKSLVKKKYGEIARKAKTQNRSSCCGGAGCCDQPDYVDFSDDYTGIEGYQSEADLGLGCGLPAEYAGIRKGDHVLDLGPGAGNDCFVARALVGEEGWVAGLDFTEAMIEIARNHLEKTGYRNIDFIQGDIEAIPLRDSVFDVVISN